jgi:hypothetical protein
VSTYDFYLKGDNGRYDYDSRISLPSVTTIVSGVLAKPQLVGYTLKTTLDCVAGIVAATFPSSKPSGSPDDVSEIVQWALDLHDTFEDMDMLREYLEENHVHPDDILHEASERGRRAHGTLESLTMLHRDGDAAKALAHAEKLLSVSKDPFVRAVCGFWLEHRPEPLCAEQVVFSLQHRYAGRLDLMADIPVSSSGGAPGWAKERCIVDLKTRRADLDMYTSDQAQTSGYKLAVLERGWNDGVPLGRRVLLAGDDGGFKLQECWTPDEAFVKLAELYYMLRKTMVE